MMHLHRVHGLLLTAAVFGCSGGSSSNLTARDADTEATDDGGSFDNASGDGAVGGGTDGGSMGVPTIPGIESLRIEPGSASITDDGAAPGETKRFKAIGTFGSSEKDVTAKVLWSLDDPGLGTIKDGLFTSGNIGGATKVRARAVNVDASAKLEVLLDVHVKSDGAPAGIEKLFPNDLKTDTVVDDDTLRIVYPSHEAMFPRNLQRVDHQWRADASFDRFEVRFESDVALVRYYTADKHLLPDATGWAWLANTHAGRSLKMSVRGVSSAAPGTVTRSKAITLYYSRSEVPGALYYWSTGAQGVLKATISSEVATKFFTDPAGSDTTCVSCHTVSRNGKRLAAAYGGEVLRVVSVPKRKLLVPADAMTKGPAYGWGTFSPDASRLFYANKGVMTMLEADTGAVEFVADLAGTKGTHPDWAPSGKHIAFAQVTGTTKMDNKNVTGSSLARLPLKANGTLGAPEVLLASTGAEDTMFFPSYSPDSKWIAFVRATGKSKDNVTSTLYLLPAAGGEPIEVTKLNERVGQEDGVTGLGNSMPTWAPSTEPGIFWLAFSSLRAYGDVLEAGRDQLWAVAIDPAKIGTGEDPSYAAFWLPFQDIAEGNHRAFWAVDTESMCPSKIEICDSLDNDCDGVVDEDCCTPKTEVCDGSDNNCDGVVDEGCCVPKAEICDGKDNDCDLVEDEGCGCAMTDTCANGKDDDCDGNVDELCGPE